MFNDAFLDGSPVLLGTSDPVRTFQLPVVADESSNGNENPGEYSIFVF